MFASTIDIRSAVRSEVAVLVLWVTGFISNHETGAIA